MGKDLLGKELGKGITQRKDGRFSARYIDNSGQRQELYNLNLKTLRKQYNDAIYEKEHGLYGSGKNITVDSWFDSWIVTYKKNKVRDATYKNYINAYQHIKNHIGYMNVNKVRPMHIQNIFNEMYDEGFAYGTINLVKITLHAMFDQCVINGYLVKNPTNGIKLPQKEVEERRVLTVIEQQEFLHYAEKSMYHNAYSLALLTGLRSGEIGGLRYSDIDYENKVMHIRRTLLFAKEKGGFYFGQPKTKTSVRDIPLKEEAIAILKNQKVEQFKLRAKSKDKWSTNPEYTDLVFTSINGNPTGHATFNLNLIRIATNINNDRKALAKIEDLEPKLFKPISMHVFRHTFTTRAFESGLKPKTIQELLGHSSIQLTMDLYTHLTDDKKREEMEKFVVINGFSNNSGVKMA
jgi:integrase